MLIGWWELISRRQHKRGQNGDDFVLVNSKSRKRVSLGDQFWTSPPEKREKPPGVLPSPQESERRTSIPEPGDVTKRHETTNLFDETDVDDEHEKRARAVDGNDIV